MRPSRTCLAGVLALTAACSNGLNASVRVVGTIRAPADNDVVCTMSYADARGHVLATHPVSGHFNFPVPVSRNPRTYRFDFRCEGFEDVSTALTLRALPEGRSADIGTIALGPMRER